MYKGKTMWLNWFLKTFFHPNKKKTLFSDYFKVQHVKVSTSKKSCVFTLAHVQYINLPFSFQGLALVAINIWIMDTK